MLGAQYSSTTLPIIFMISILAVKACNTDQIGKYNIYLLNQFVNYLLNLILALKENDLLSPSILKGYAVCIK